jgi:hypothetical protein
MVFWRLGVVAASKSSAKQVAAGYFFGEGIAQQVLYSNDSVSNLSGTNWGGSVDDGQRGTSNTQSTSNGYVMGGLDPAFKNRIGKFNFTTRVFSNLSDTLSVGTRGMTGFSSSTAVYGAGGYIAFNQVSTVAKVTFSTDSRSNLPTGLNTARKDGGGFNSTTHGYVCGGDTPTPISTIEKFAFSDDSRSLPSATLSSARRLLSTVSGQSTTHGYIVGGYNATVVSPEPNRTTSLVQKFTFSTDTMGSLATGLPSPKYGTTSVQSTTHIYNSSGVLHPGTSQTDAYKFAFADDSRSTLAATMYTGNYASGLSSLG